MGTTGADYKQIMIKALIFDFYGVIYSNFDWDVIDERIYPDEVKAKEFRALKRTANQGDLSNKEFLTEVSRIAEDEKHPDKPAVKLDSSVNYSILGFIESMKNKYKIGLLSNGTHEHINSVFGELGGANKFFDVVVTSSDTQFIKPSKEAFAGITKKLDVKPKETVVIDDSPSHIEGAKKAGLKTIEFNDMRQLRRDIEYLGIN